MTKQISGRNITDRQAAFQTLQHLQLVWSKVARMGTALTLCLFSMDLAALALPTLTK
jgi:hypothetical protein